MPAIHSVATSLAPHEYSQEELTSALMDQWSSRYFNPQRILDFQRNVLVGSRRLALPLERYKTLRGFGEANSAWIETAVPMATQACKTILDKANLSAQEITLVASTTVTGVAVPSLEARLMNTVGFSRNTRRLPIMGLGCLGGVAGINRVGDFLQGHPKAAALLVAVELCSLTHQQSDLSIPNIIASGLFGDGCAAVLMVGDQHPLANAAPFQWFAPRSAFFPNTERIMGWDMVDTGFKVVLSPKVPSIVAEEIPGEVTSLLQEHGYERKQLDFVVAHPGGPKVLKALTKALELDPNDLADSWASLEEHGNMSSCSVLFVLQRALERSYKSESLGLMAAMGPGFCAELCLLKSSKEAQ